jgi:hypothetical protein
VKTFIPSISTLEQLLSPNATVYVNSDDLPASEVPRFSSSMAANSYFFGHPIWGGKNTLRPVIVMIGSAIAGKQLLVVGTTRW